MHKLFLFWLILFGAAPILAAIPPCDDHQGSVALIAPRILIKDKPSRFLVGNAIESLQSLTLVSESGASEELAVTHLGGPPWGLSAEVPRLASGVYRLEAVTATGERHCVQTVTVHAGPPLQPVTRPPASADWNLAHELLFALWIEHLFDAPPDENLSFPTLEPVLRNARRNSLHDYLGQDEDSRIPATPDCADLPYYLRAYFAWKMGLPFSYRACSRGTARAAPVCGIATVHTGFMQHKTSAADFRALLRPLLDTVHSGSARTALVAEASDFYPVPLQRNALWPGTVYADPYGHVLMIAQWLPQTVDRPGILFAVDAQPDNSITRKRYWEGNFLYAHDLPGAGPGFKAFRPVTRDGQLPGNAVLATGNRYAPYSIEQANHATDAFHARIRQLVNPDGLQPRMALQTQLDALIEQLQTRVTAVDNGTRYRNAHPRDLIPMPEGAAIFETIGPWEDYSTPSRDLRLMIALEVLSGLPAQVVIHPELFRLDGMLPELAKEELEEQLRQALQAQNIGYLRSDGSRWSLSLADIYARRAQLEMAYNPNDCPEIRWGARRGTAEYQTCRLQAPFEQKKRMERYRSWFREGRRPSR